MVIGIDLNGASAAYREDMWAIMVVVRTGVLRSVLEFAVAGLPALQCGNLVRSGRKQP